MRNYTAMASSKDFHLFFHLPHAYHLIFKDDVSESQENQCILHLFQITAKNQGAKSKKYPVVMSHWKDNVIIVFTKGLAQQLFEKLRKMLAGW